MPPQADLDRLQREYADRHRRLAGSDIYSPFNKANLFALQQRQREVLTLLRRHGVSSLADRAILEVGCGAGGVLAQFLSDGANPNCLYGLDILPDRLAEAKARLAGAVFLNANGTNIPFRSGVFDLVLQFTAFSSVLDPVVRQGMAREMLRVLKPGGLILWYDFWLNPTNHQTHGIRPPEIRQLFPGCGYDFRRITLAPPVARRLVPVSWLLCAFLEKLRIFNTHYLLAIQKNNRKP